MIVLVGTAAHRYTHATIERAVPWFRRLSYGVLFARSRLPVATYIFTDLDRLGFWEIELAASCYRQLEAAGCRVLNDPARALPRLPLLQRMYREGHNRFTAWAAYDVDLVDRYPVFVRTSHAHRGVLSEPLAGPDELRHALAALVDRGFAMTDLIVVEYCAEPVREGFFRKPSVYRVGDRMIAVPSVHQAQWSINLGTARLATEADYAEDLARMTTNPFGEAARRAFETASIDYGRADVGVVGGEPQIYEINTNPMMSEDPVKHHSPLRVEAYRQSNALYRDALAAIDTPPVKHKVAIGGPATRTWRRSRSLVRGLRMPVVFDMP